MKKSNEEKIGFLKKEIINIDRQSNIFVYVLLTIPIAYLIFLIFHINIQFFFMIFVIDSLLYLFIIMRQLYMQNMISKWSKVKCMIVDKEIKKEIVYSSTYYLAVIYYTYTFDKKRFFSNVYQQNKSYSKNQDEALKIFDTYDKNKSYYCYVNKHNPNEAVLINSINKNAFLYDILAFGIFAMLVVIWLNQYDLIPF